MFEYPRQSDSRANRISHGQIGKVSPSRAARSAGLLLSILLIAASAVAQPATDAPAPGRPGAGRADRDATQVLFIGNSLIYYNEMPWVLEQIARSRRVKLHAVFVGGGGMTLRQHWQEGRAVGEMRAHHYDFVVLQPQSSEIIANREETAQYARLLTAEARSAGAKPLIFQTWAPRNSAAPQSEYDRRYAALAQDLGAAVVPVGAAWQKLRDHGMELFDGSGVHANLKGTYLAACVFYSAITGTSPLGAIHTFNVQLRVPAAYDDGLLNERIANEQADVIQRAAWDEVRGRPDRQ
jgi:hypothetical protein